jgi:alkylated DNA repair dioxygenase AlkB
MLKYKTKIDVELITIDLTSGSLLLMQGKTQEYWLHQIPKTKKEVKTRINLTFRRIIN